MEEQLRLLKKELIIQPRAIRNTLQKNFINLSDITHLISSHFVLFSFLLLALGCLNDLLLEVRKSWPLQGFCLALIVFLKFQ